MMPLGRVVVCMKHYIGDAVMVSPIFGPLEREADRVVYAVRGPVGDLLDTPGGNREIWRMPRAQRVADVLAEARRLRAGKFSTAFVINQSVRAALTARLAGIPVRVGHVKEPRGWLLTHRVPYGANEYETACAFELLRAVGMEDRLTHPCLEVSAAERERGDALRAGATVAIQPGARYGAKQIPPAVMAELARGLVADGPRLVMVGGPDEAEMAAAFVRDAGLDGGGRSDVVNLVGACGLRETMAVLAGCQLAVGGDTGVMHVAAAVGCRTVTAFGPTPARKWGHDYAPHRVLVAPDGDMSRLDAETLRQACRG
ncbi:MAG: glycosyltransferase family 9 protein [Fimbriimonadaceae bacterium]|nr:glycosyltransferase family 9 protein [Fimbriimonadaceae bacterium]